MNRSKPTIHAPRAPEARWSRRGLLGAAGLVGAASLAGAVGPSSADAGSAPLLVDAANTGTGTTALRADVSDATFQVRNRKTPSDSGGAPGTAIAAYVGPKAPSQPGSTAVYAENSAKPIGNQATYGVQGRAKGAAATGVLGFADAGGVGVMGTTNGMNASSAGVWGDLAGRRGAAGKFTASPDSRALETVGRLAFSQAGLRTIPKGADSVVIEDVHAGAGSLALATLQGAPEGVHVVSAEIHRLPRVATLEIHLSEKAREGGVNVGYFIVDALNVS